ncbi:MAG: amidophosphoribosyltransferase [Chloroflexi bacterium]|nr:amidophosphoribosyltransferase [Chloroflexota bacterium]
MVELRRPVDWLDDEHPQEECGVLGIYAPHEDVARMAFFGLYALQHRGQEAAGIAVADGRAIHMHKDVGLVSQVFSPERIAALKGDFAIGHVRYSTTGSSALSNAQPFLIDTQYGPIAVAHNGNLVNAAELRSGMLRQGVGFSSSSDSEVLTMMLAGAPGATWFERIQHVMRRWQGAYSLVILTRDQLFAVRDPWGIRPLTVGMLPGGGHAVASESGALRSLGCQAIREVRPGEVILLTDTALSVGQALPPAEQTALCTFEHIYFSRPDSFWDGRSVHQVRQRLGGQLADEAPAEADVVVPVPDSSIPAAIGYAARSGIPYNDGFIKNRYIGRTFIEPTDSLRKMGVMLKYNVINENVLDKRVVLIDDSIVRGNTTGPLVRLLREAGAREVHLRITCPPIRHPCFMGVDMGTYAELVAHRHSLEEIRAITDADSLAYLSLEGMMQAIGRADGYCNACFTGTYPFAVNAHSAKTGFEESA